MRMDLHPMMLARLKLYCMRCPANAAQAAHIAAHACGNAPHNAAAATFQLGAPIGTALPLSKGKPLHHLLHHLCNILYHKIAVCAAISANLRR
jgi:hypothetical protein